MPRRDDKASPKLRNNGGRLVSMETSVHDEWRKWKYEKIPLPERVIVEDVPLGEDWYEEG